MTSRTRNPLSRLRANPEAAGGGTITVIVPPPPSPPVAGDCNWLKQLKHFTTGERFVLAETKKFQNCYETVLFQFHFVVRTAFVTPILDSVLVKACLCTLFTGAMYVRL